MSALWYVGDGEEKALCAAWLAPLRELRRALHPSVDPAVLGDAATIGLVLYSAYLIGSVGRGIHVSRQQ